MDTSPKYIQMCEKAEEIQALRATYESWEDGDYYFDPSSKSGEDLFCSGCINERWTGEQYRLFNGKAIWLPRQDELQEMVREQPPCERLFWRFRKWWDSQIVKGEREEDNYPGNENLDYESFEQLWLAYVMKEKFGEVWNGQDWVKIPVEVKG